MSLEGQPIDVSIVIPAYNEAQRLPPFLDQLVASCAASRLVYEIIVVDDGSRDDTARLVASAVARTTNLTLLQLPRNRGKGSAIKRGLLASRGAIALFLDADGSVAPDEIEQHLPWLQERGYDVVIGSRALRGPGQRLSVRAHRKWLGELFNLVARTLLLPGIRDTQCGLKYFRRDVIAPVFSLARVPGFGADLEILYLARRLGYRIKEIPISWHHVSRSKVRLLADSLSMLANLIQIRWWHRRVSRPRPAPDQPQACRDFVRPS